MAGAEMAGRAAYGGKRGPALRRAEAMVPLRADGSLRVAIVSDTHSKPHPRTMPLVAALAPDAILHGGDIGDLGVLDALAALAPVIAVRGNIDERAPHLPDVVTIHVRDGDESALTILLTHVAVAGARIRAYVDSA